MLRRFFRVVKSSAISTAVLATCAASVGSCSKPPPSTVHGVTLQNDKMSVVIDAPFFALHVKNATGATILESSYGDAATNKDKSQYGALATWHREITVMGHVIEGWDAQVPTDEPTKELEIVTKAVKTSDTTASIDVWDGVSAFAHVDVTLDGTELKVDATASGKTPAVDGDVALPNLNTISMAFKLPADEHFFGLGERPITTDHRGTTYGSWVEEGGLAAGESIPPGPTNPSPNGAQMTHAPIPFFYSSKGYAAWIDSTYRTGTSFGGELPDAWRLWAAEPTMHLHVFVHDDPKDSLADFTAKTGRAHLPAPWVFGPRRRVDRNAQVMGVPEIQLMRQKNVPCTSVDDATHFLPIGSQVGAEQEIAKWTSDLHTSGYKAIAYYNAYVSTTDPKAATDYAYGKDHGYFVKLDDGTEFDTFMISAGPQSVATIDMTNPDAVTWYGTLLQRALDLQYDGFMLDFGEYLPPHAKMFDGRTGFEAHNAFPLAYQKATFDYMTKAKGNDFMFFARAGYTGTAANIVVHWSGDPDASFDDAKGLPAQVRAGITAGMSGIPFWGSDVSGYTCLNNPPADKEVFLRWVEFGALSPEMHEENACSGTKQQTKWTLWSDAETTQIYSQYALLHTRLFPYLYATAKEATLTGMPVMRHPFLVTPNEPDAYSSDLEYFYGPSLFVAPVAHRGLTARDVWLPPLSNGSPAKYVDWWTLDPLSSGHVMRQAPLDVLPLFLKSGGVVAMLDPSIQTLAPATDPSVVTTDKVAGVLDVRAAIDAGTGVGTAQLNDGTELDVALVAGSLTLPAGITMAPDDATLATCSGCGRIDVLPSGVTRVRLTTASEGKASAAVGGLTLAHDGPKQRIRWDVAVLP